MAAITSADRQQQGAPNLLRLLIRRARAAFAQPLMGLPWKPLTTSAILYFLVLFVWAWSTGFLEWRTTSLAAGPFIRAGLILLLFPGMAEELVFRVLLLPHPSESRSSGNQTGWLAVGVVAFVLWHVVNAWLFFPVARPVFWDWRFLVITAWMAWICGGVYLRGGSIWPPVFLHWSTVVAWKACFAGPVFFE